MTKPSLMNGSEQLLGTNLDHWQPPIAPNRQNIKNLIKSFQGNYCKLLPLNAKEQARDLFNANQSLSAKTPNPDQNWLYLPYGPFPNLEAYQHWLQSIEDKTDPFFFSVVCAAHARPVGLASFLRIKPDCGSIEIGHIHFSPLLQGTTAATEALYLMIDWCFQQGYRRCEWKCNALNQRSRQAAQRLGFSYEGVFRQAMVVKNRNRDTAWFAIIDRDWPALKNCFQQFLQAANFDEYGRQRQALRALTQPLLYATDPE